MTLRLLMLLVALVPSLLHAQGLGDAAAKERTRRAKDKPPARVITNADLEQGRPPGAKKPEGSDAADQSAPAPAPESAPEPTPFEDRNAAERPYLDAITQAQARITAAEARIVELNGKLNPQSTTYIYGPTGSNSANEELQVRSELNGADAALTAARAALDEANRALQNARQGRSAADKQM